MECKDIPLVKSGGFEIIVLIETSWNVKKKKRYLLLVAVKCINRNIVECKVVNPSEQVESDALY